MDIWVPKYKEIYVKDGAIKNSFGVKAEWRAVLRGPDGRVKHDTGWKDNDILDNGIKILSQYSSAFNILSLGTDGTAVSTSQTGMLGTHLASNGSVTNVINGNSGSPNYIKSAQGDHVFAPGTGTGTIAEITMGRHSSPTPTQLTDDQTSRFVVSPAIVKGALDELTVSHKYYIYPNTADASGTITISGVGDYNYTLREMGAQYQGGSYKDTILAWKLGSLATFIGGMLSETRGDVSALEPYYTSMTLTDDKGAFTGANYSYGGTGASSYQEVDLYADIDSNLEGTFTRLTARRERSTWVGIQCIFDKVAGGGGILKENTHELHLVWQLYPARYP